jgi:hypothetical protein
VMRRLFTENGYSNLLASAFRIASSALRLAGSPMYSDRPTPPGPVWSESAVDARPGSGWKHRRTVW